MPAALRRRTVLAAALAAPALVRHARAADVERFALGVASGAPTSDGIVLWTRLTGAGLPPAVDVRWELAHDERFVRIAASGVETAVAGDAHSVHAEAGGLDPGRWYWYRFVALGRVSAVGRTRTAPAPDAAATLTFVTASCQRWDKGHYAAWRHAAADAPDLVLFLGDYIYEYAGSAVRPTTDGWHPDPLTRFRNRHALHKSDASLQAAHAACPWLLVWDDHEVENDYAGVHPGVFPGPLGDFAARRAAAYRAYWEHMPLPKSARPIGVAMRMHGRLDWGLLARIHLLDGRQLRDAPACRDLGRLVWAAECPELRSESRSLLGMEQERWLADGWDLQRPWNLLAQQTLMTRLAQPFGPARGDSWDGYPAARARLFGTVAERRVPGVVALGGDVHASYVATLPADAHDARSRPVATEFCGTSISSEGPTQARVQATRRAQPLITWADGGRRGYWRFRLDSRGLAADACVLDDVRDPASGIATAARFVVDPARPGAETA